MGCESLFCFFAFFFFSFLGGFCFCFVLALVLGREVELELMGVWLGTQLPGRDRSNNGQDVLPHRR